MVERGVEARSGHGSRALSEGERRSRPERSFATLGQNKRPSESTDKTGPAKKDIEGEMIEGKPQETKWYFKTSLIVTAFLCVGPLALPLVWFNPRFSQKTKIIVTIIVIILSYYLGLVLIKSLRSIKDYYGIIFQKDY